MSDKIEELRSRDFGAYHLGRKLNELIRQFNALERLLNVTTTKDTDDGYPGRETTDTSHDSAQNTGNSSKLLQSDDETDEGEKPGGSDSEPPARSDVPEPDTD